MNNFLVFFVLTLLYIFFGGVVSWKLFFRGRAQNGNVGWPHTSGSNVPEELWFNQSLDHFDPLSTEHWKQRYFVNDSFFDSTNGPVFLMIGGEGTASPKWVINGTWLRYAKKNNALCILLEHRYYGKSHPVKDLAVKSLSYLSSQQALADIASFIDHYNQKLGRHAKWIVFGGSYAGSLAAWMRLKFPHLVLGAVSSSGPLLAVKDFKDYYNIVGEALRSYDGKCVDAIEEGTKQIMKLLSDGAGRQNLFKLFELCDEIDPENKNDISSLYETLASNFAAVVQYNNDNRYDPDFTGLEVTIDLVCDIMTNKSAGQEVDRLAIVNSIILRDNKETCLDYKYEKLIKDMTSVYWTSKAAKGMRQWVYQTCTEFGFFQTSTLNITKKLFGPMFPVEFFELQCKDIFGEKFDKHLLGEGIRRTNMIYGGLEIQVDNVVFVQGSVDPWSALGITRTLRKKAPAIYITGTSHCANMYPSSPKDLPQLVAARNEIEKIIETWLNE